MVFNLLKLTKSFLIPHNPVKNSVENLTTSEPKRGLSVLFLHTFSEKRNSKGINEKLYCSE